MRISATADNHIFERAAAGGKIVPGADGRSIRAADRERCLMAVADGAIARGVDAVVHAGDLFETSRPTPREYRIAEGFIDPICRAGIPLVMVACNHGLSQSPLEDHALVPLIGRHPNLHIILRPDVLTVQTKSGPIQVAALPWPQRSTLAAKEELSGLSPEGLNALIGEKLTAIIHSLLARRQPGLPFILVGHIMLREAIFGGGQSAPDTSGIMVSADAFSGFDTAILGDVHNAQSFGEEGRIFYCGSTDRMNFGEEHNAPGWWLVALDGDQFSKEMIETPARRYVTLSPSDAVELDEQGALNDWLHMPLTDMPIVRIKARLSQEEYDAFQPTLASWRELAMFSEQIEITRQTRARSEAMNSDLSEEAALAEWHRSNSRPEDLGELLQEHRRLAGVGK